ncbi:AAA family ATPase [uncultured Haemophilus sp.]|uniref:AAA family ATPase n=1 Tax=uncultured Haemophilus sp. TaxID=237779 RepID=UPI002624E6E3|nr:AAA family ATPase [uncultured Haemophilus sp.]
MALKTNNLEISRIEIDSLFESFNYIIDLKSDGNYIKIITAPNGYGKSTILNIIDRFISNDFMFFVDLSFKEIRFYLSGSYEPIKIVKNRHKYKTDSVVFYYGECILNVDNGFFDSIKYIDSNLPIIYKGRGVWETFDSEEISLKELLYRFKGNFSVRELYENTKWLYEFTDKIKVFYISTNRLFSIKNRNIDFNNEDVLMILELQKSIKKQIQDSLNDYTLEGRAKEASFPKRLLKIISESDEVNSSKIDKITKINELISEIRVHEENLKKIGILDEVTLNDNSINDLISEIRNSSGLSVLQVYLDDKLSKLNKLKSILNKVLLFKTTLDRLLSFKKVKVSLEKGFSIFPNSNKKKFIPLSELSSGEQHLILLVGNLIFNIKKGSLVLIDEPEISLHSSWQLDFINIIEDIRKINDFSLIIATHAFTLINDYWDNTIELAEQYDTQR